jgi:hypothetical protein
MHKNNSDIFTAQGITFKVHCIERRIHLALGDKMTGGILIRQKGTLFAMV